jgi:hypothetical protein
MTNDILSELFQEKLRKIAHEAVIQQMLTGNCSIKISTDDSGNIDMEIVNPFKGCDCGDYD